LNLKFDKPKGRVYNIFGKYFLLNYEKFSGYNEKDFLYRPAINLLCRKTFRTTRDIPAQTGVFY